VGQRTGLKYFEDFKQRIPRAEVAAIGGVVYDAVEAVLDCQNAPDADMLFCSVLGRCFPFIFGLHDAT
jgi:hypothetical protein